MLHIRYNGAPRTLQLSNWAHATISAFFVIGLDDARDNYSSRTPQVRRGTYEIVLVRRI